MKSKQRFCVDILCRFIRFTDFDDQFESSVNQKKKKKKKKLNPVDTMTTKMK